MVMVGVVKTAVELAVKVIAKVEMEVEERAVVGRVSSHSSLRSLALNKLKRRPRRN